MAREFTHRVYLPDGNTVYVTDEAAGFQRLVEAYEHFGNLKVEVCRYEWGKFLSDAKIIHTTTLKELVEEE